MLTNALSIKGVKIDPLPLIGKGVILYFVTSYKSKARSYELTIFNTPNHIHICEDHIHYQPTEGFQAAPIIANPSSTFSNKHDESSNESFPSISRSNKRAIKKLFSLERFLNLNCSIYLHASNIRDQVVLHHLMYPNVNESAKLSIFSSYTFKNLSWFDFHSNCVLKSHRSFLNRLILFSNNHLTIKSTLLVVPNLLFSLDSRLLAYSSPHSLTSNRQFPNLNLGSKFFFSILEEEEKKDSEHKVETGKRKRLRKKKKTNCQSRATLPFSKRAGVVSTQSTAYLPTPPTSPQRSFISEPKSAELVPFSSFGPIFKTKTENHDPLRRNGGIGLVNLGNTCYLNSAIQLLSSIRPFVNYFLNEFPQSSIYQIQKTQMTLPYVFSELVTNLFESSDSRTSASSSFAPIAFHQAFMKCFPYFTFNTQHDAQECLSSLLDEFHEQLKKMQIPLSAFPTIHMSESMNANLGEENVNEKMLKSESSPICDLFQGKFQSDIQCNRCKHISTTYPPFQFLSLPLPQPEQFLIDIILIRLTQKPIYYSFWMTENDKITDLFNQIRATDLRLMTSNFFCSKIKNNTIFKCFHENEPIQALRNNEGTVVIYEYNGSANFINLPTYNSSVTEAFALHEILEPSSTSCIYLLHRQLKKNKLCSFVPSFFSKTCFPSTSHSSECISKLSNDSSLKRTMSGKYKTTKLIGLPWLLMNTTSSLKPADLYAKVDALMKVNGIHPTWWQKSRSLGYLFHLKQRFYKLRIVDTTGTHCGYCPSSISCLGCVIDPTSTSYLHLAPNCYLSIDYEVPKANLFFQKIEVSPQQAPCSIPLEKVLHDYVKPEMVTGYYCNQCQCITEAEKKETIFQLPQVMLVHFKRFYFDKKGISKNKIPIQVHLHQGLDMGPYLSPSSSCSKTQYQLTGMMDHSGDLNWGHYFATTKYLGQWYQFNDEKVTLCQPALQTINSSQVYVQCWVQNGV